MSVDEFSAALLRWSMRFATDHYAPWARAMFAELPHAETRMSRLRWSSGCSFLLFRQWIQRKLFRSAQSAWEGRTMKRPAIAVLLTCAVLMAVLLCIPEFREGVGVASALVRNTVGSLRGDYSDHDLQRMAERAKATHNADLLAYAALRNFGSEAIRWADDAVRMKPELRWIYAEFCSDMRWDNTAECGDGIAQLEAQDATNSMPFLLEAGRIAHKLDPNSLWLDKAPNNARWREVMGKAFAAARYDDYSQQYSDLQRRVYVEQHASSLTEFGDGLFRSAVPQFAQPRNYARNVLTDNPQATIDFARRVIAGSNSSFEQYLATGLLLQAYARANQIKPGTVSELQIASDKRILTLSADRERMYFPVLDRSAGSFQVVVFCQAIACAALLVLLVAGTWQLARRRVIGMVLQTLLSFAGSALALCSVAMLLIYRPYSALIHDFLRNGRASSSLAPYPFVELYYPNRWLGPTSAGWSALLVFCGIALIAVLARAVRQHRATLKPVTL
jgi:hypothetical protein